MRKHHFIAVYIISVLAIPTHGFAQTFWQPTHGPFGGTIWNLTVDKIGALIVQDYENAYSKGLFFSKDNGKNWDIILPDSQVMTSAIAPNGSIFVATGCPVYNIAYADPNIVVSTDEGASWNRRNILRLPLFPQLLVFDSSGNLFASDRTALCRSTDLGITWSKIDTFVRSPTDSINTRERNEIIKAIHIAPNGVFYAHSEVYTGYSRFYRSTDTGKNWVVTDSSTSGGLGEITFDRFGRIVRTFGREVVHSLDSGKTWLHISTPVHMYGFIGAPGSDGKGKLFAGTDSGVIVSTDDGYNWTRGFTGLAAGQVQNTGISPSGRLFAGMDEGLFTSSDNGITWFKIGVPDASVFSLGETESGALVVSREHYLSITADKGQSWYEKNVSDHIWSFGSGPKGIFYGVGPDNDVEYFHGNGKEYSYLGKPPISYNTNHRISLAVNLYRTLFAGDVTEGVFRSSDSGATWIAVDTGLTVVRIMIPPAFHRTDTT